MLTMLELRSSLPITDVADEANSAQFEPISPALSKVKARIPLSDHNYPVRLKYRNYHGHVRVGRILEDFDTLAVATSYQHNELLEWGVKSLLLYLRLLKIKLHMKEKRRWPRAPSNRHCLCRRHSR